MEQLEAPKIKLEDFAKQVGTSPNNIRGHIKKYAAELKGHVDVIPKRGGTWLDAKAQEIIRGKMRIDTVIIHDNRVNELLEENNKLLHQINELLTETTELKLAATKHFELQAAHEDLKQKLQEAEARAYNAELEADTQREAADNLHRDLIATVSKNEELQETNKKQGNLINRIDEELQKAARLNAELQERAEQSEAELEAIKNRGFWGRLFNR